MDYRRNEMAIVAEILRVALDGPGITKVMYSVNLNHRAASRYLNQLQKKGLIETTNQCPRKQFHTTPMGKEILDRLEETVQFLQH